MGLPVMVMGRSGSGKTYALKNFKPDEVGVISVEKGRLPFRSELKTVRVPKSFDSDDIKSYAQLNAAKYAPASAPARTPSNPDFARNSSTFL